MTGWVIHSQKDAYTKGVVSEFREAAPSPVVGPILNRFALVFVADRLLAARFPHLQESAGQRLVTLLTLLHGVKVAAVAQPALQQTAAMAVTVVSIKLNKVWSVAPLLQINF